MGTADRLLIRSVPRRGPWVQPSGARAVAELTAKRPPIEVASREVDKPAARLVIHKETTPPRDLERRDPRVSDASWQQRLGIAVQHQPVGADFPAFQPIQKAHAEQIGLHLSVRHHQRRH
jgi:hypothetical protein